MSTKTILITGAGSGIGQTLAETFSQHNWQVLATSHNELDVTNQTSIRQFVEKLHNQPIDVLINCAGVFDSTSVDDDNVVQTVPEIAHVFQVNSIAPRLMAEALVPNLQLGQEKLVVTISSIMGTHAAMDDYHAQHWVYSASKSAVNYVMRAFTKTYPTIKSVLIHPGWVKTKMGGIHAQIEPALTAQHIFDLIEDHKNTLPNGKLVSYTGKIMRL